MPYFVYHNQRYVVLKAMLMLSTGITLFLSLLNFYLGNTQLGIIEGAITLFGVVCIWQFERIVTTKNVKPFSILFTSLLLGLMMYAFTLQGMSLSVYVWVFLIPLISYNLTGVKYGFIITAVFISLAAVIFMQKNNLSITGIQLTSLSDVLPCILVTWVLTHLYEKTNIESKIKLTQMASKDPLTGLYNRYALQEMFDRQKLYDMSLVILDIDYFKKINDTYGHDAGDDVLVQVANMLLAMKPVTTKSATANVFRLGGEEFGILLPKYDLPAAKVFANEVITALRETVFTYQDSQIRITASAGVAYRKSPTVNAKQTIQTEDAEQNACHPAAIQAQPSTCHASASDTCTNTLGDLMKAADNCLYKAKHTGRDKVLAC